MFIDLLEENNRNDYYENNQLILSSPNIIYQDYNYRYYHDKPYANAYGNDSIENRCMYDTFNDNKYEVYMTQFPDEKTTAFKSNKIITKKNSNPEPLKLVENKKIKTDSLPIFYSFDDIKQSIFKNDDYKNKFMFNVDNVFIKDKKLEEPYLNKKRLRDDNDIDYYNYNYNYEESERDKYISQRNKPKRGRKSNNEESSGDHNRMCADNIIKKIKAEFFKYMVIFLNKIISNPNSENNDIIYKLDYRFINQLNREIDLKYLNMPLKDLFSLDVSPKYRKLAPETNKKNIEKILYENPDEPTKFVFNMTFRDWLDIFTYKKKVEELLYEYHVEDYSNDICSKIEQNLVGVDELFNKLENNDNKYYFSNFAFYLYNYELWFFSKKGRKSKKSKKIKEVFSL